MTEINILQDCDNSPKRKFIKEFNIAFAKGDADFIIEHVSDDIIWLMHGDKKIVGKDDFVKEIQLMKANTAHKLIIKSIITHGKQASANGAIRISGNSYMFCDVYEFKTAGRNIIKTIESYVIAV